MAHPHPMQLRNRAQAQPQQPSPITRTLKLEEFDFLQDIPNLPVEAIIALEAKMVKGYGSLHLLLAQTVIDLNFQNRADRNHILESVYWMKRYLVYLKTKAREFKCMDKANVTGLASLQTAYTAFLSEQSSRKFDLIREKARKVDIFATLVDPLLESMRTPRMTQGLRRLLAEKIEGPPVAVALPANPRPILVPVRTLPTQTSPQRQTSPLRPPYCSGSFTFAPPCLPQYGIATNTIVQSSVAIVSLQSASDTSSLARPSKTVFGFGARKRRPSSSSPNEDKRSPEDMHAKKRTKYAEGDRVVLARRRRLRAVRRQQEALPTPDIPVEELERIKAINRRELDDLLAEVGGAYGGLTYQQLVQLQQQQQVQGLDVGSGDKEVERRGATMDCMDMESTRVVARIEERGGVQQSDTSQGGFLDLEETMDLNLENVMHDGPVEEVVLTGNGTVSTSEALPQRENLPMSQTSQKSSSSGTTSGTYVSCRSSQPNTDDSDEELELESGGEQAAKEADDDSTVVNVEPEEDIHIVPGQGVDQGHGDAEAQMDQNDEDGEGYSGADREQEAVHNSGDGEAEMDQRGADTRMDVNLDVPAVKGTQVEEQEDAVQEMDTNESPVAPESKSWFPFGLGRWFRRSDGK